MGRLTKPTINPYTNKKDGYIQNNKEIKNINFYGDSRDLDLMKVFDKLGQLEDIEEELGLPLTVFFKCMAIVYEGEKDTCKNGHLIDLNYCKRKVVIDENVYSFASYGKSWELE